MPMDGSGRRAEELIATSGALTLVTNCVMAWNTMRLQRAVDRETGTTPARDCINALKSIGPVGHSHINFRGTFRFRSTATLSASYRKQLDPCNYAALHERNRDYLHGRYATLDRGPATCRRSGNSRRDASVARLGRSGPSADRQTGRARITGGRAAFGVRALGQ